MLRATQTKQPVLGPPTKSHLGGVVLGAVAVAAIGAGVALLVNGLGMQQRLKQGTPGDDGRLRSELSGSEARTINDAASAQLGLAAGAGAVGLALGVTATIVW